MKKITLKQVLRALVIYWIFSLTAQIYIGVHRQIDEVTSGYGTIDPLQDSDSPNIYKFEGWMTIIKDHI